MLHKRDNLIDDLEKYLERSVPATLLSRVNGIQNQERN